MRIDRSRVHVALVSNYGVAPAKFNSTSLSYTIDLTDPQVLPATPCASSSQFQVSGGAGLVLTNLPVGAFDLLIQYPGQNGGSNCNVSYTQKVDLSSGEPPCPSTFIGSNTNPQCQ